MGVPVEFCEKFLQSARKTIPIFEGVQASKSRGTWIPTNKKFFGAVVTQHESHAEVCLEEKTKEETKHLFNHLVKHRLEIDKKYGGELRWEFLPDNKRSKIMTYPVKLGYADPKQWESLIEQLVKDASDFFKSTNGYL